MISNPFTSHSKAGRAMRAAAFAAIVGVGLVASASASSAMSPYVPTHSVRAGDCVVTAGAAYDGAHGWAIGAAAAPCAYRHAYTTVTVRLWFWNGSSWRHFTSTDRTTTFYNSYGFGNRELHTGGVCGGPRTWWYTEVDYTISGVGSGWVTNAMQPYQPGAC